MATRDPAFLWETEAIRDTRDRHDEEYPTPSRERLAGWVTLRQASQATGIPIETIRKWARRDTIDSQLDMTTPSPLRLVNLGDVLDRAEKLGREVHPSPEPVRVTETENLPRQSTEPETPEPSAESEAPSGTMIVPIAAWDKMLMQLGNLHEAGQQLAEARERAAKAETEAIFLRERLAELRREVDTAKASPSIPMPEPVIPGPPPRRPDALWRQLLRQLRRRLP